LTANGAQKGKEGVFDRVLVEEKEKLEYGKN
jgi:hypothetical protein